MADGRRFPLPVSFISSLGENDSAAIYGQHMTFMNLYVWDLPL